MEDKERLVVILNKEAIGRLVEEQGLLSGFIDLNTQLTPNGFDLTVAQIFEFKSCGALDFSNKERNLPETIQLRPRKLKQKDKFGWWKLKKGCYKIMTNEIVKLPNDLIAVAFSRSSLLRMGVFVQTAAWDAGFQGRSEFILVVENKAGLRLKENARVAQLVFFRTAKTTQGYQGIYQNL